jgi:hypothetical protein
MAVLIFKNFLDVSSCNQLNDWVDLGVENKWLSFGNSEGRVTTRNYGEKFEYPNIAYEVFDKITNKLSLQDLSKSVIGKGKNGIVASCTFPKGNLYVHTDPKEGELEVLRCNIMTRSAESGGELYVGGNKIDINVGDLHCYLASTVEHYITEVKGKTSRVMWMFGYQCSQERFNKLNIV